MDRGDALWFAHGLISARDIMAPDPHLPATSPCPVTGPPDVIHAPGPVTGTAIVRPIANSDYDRPAPIIWSATIVRPVIAGISRIITSASTHAHKCRKQKNQQNQSPRSGFRSKNVHLHMIIFGFARISRACFRARAIYKELLTLAAHRCHKDIGICIAKDGFPSFVCRGSPRSRTRGSSRS
jgi:hypothetical protein